MGNQKKSAVRNLLFFCFVLLISVVAVPAMSNFNASAMEKLILEEDVYIYDKNNLLDAEVKEKLNKSLIDLDEKTDSECYVVLLKEIGSQTLQEYAEKLFNELQLGKDCALLLVSKNDNDAMLVVGNDLKSSFDKAGCNQFIKSEFENINASGYTIVTKNIVNNIIPVFEKKYDVEIKSNEPIKIWVVVVIVIVFIIIILLIIRFADAGDIIEMFFEFIGELIENALD